MPVLAIDQGTTSTRALMVDDEGKVAITHAMGHRQHYPGPGRGEHDPSELVANERRAIDENHGHHTIGVDSPGESCLAWNAGASELVLARAGLPMDSYCSASKLAWILDNVEEAARLRRAGKLRLGTTDAFFLDRLTGRHVTDITTASRTSMMNLETGQWDPE